MALTLVVIAALAFTAPADAAVVSAPFSDNFNDTTVGPWVQNGGTWTHGGSVLNATGTTTGNQVAGATVEVSNVGGASTDGFTVSATLQSDDATPTTGFGLLSSNSNLGANSNSYYLIDITDSQLRIGQINISAGGGIGTEFLDTTSTGYSFSTSETYTLAVDVTYGVSDITIDATLTSTGGDNATLSATDATPLTGQHCGFETWSSNNVDFDDFSITVIPEPSAFLLAALGLLGLLAWGRRRRR